MGVEADIGHQQKGLFMKAWFSSCLGLFVWLPAVTLAGGPFDGSFLADRRPESVIYLQLMQQGREVSGLLMIVAPAAKQGTQDLRVRARGTADGGRVLLELGQEAIKVERHGSILVMQMPADGGGLIPMVLMPSDDARFNQVVSRFKTEVMDRQARAAEAERSMKANQARIRKIEDRFYDLLSAITNTRIDSQLEAMQRGTKEVEHGVARLEKTLQTLKTMAAVRPIDCQYLAIDIGQQLNIDLKSQGYNIDVLGQAQRIRADRQEMLARLANVEPTVAKVRGLAQEYEQLLKVTDVRTLHLRRKPDDEKEVLAAYEAKARAAEKALPALETELQGYLARAQAIVGEGNAVVSDLRQQANCRR